MSSKLRVDLESLTRLRTPSVRPFRLFSAVDGLVCLVRTLVFYQDALLSLMLTFHFAYSGLDCNFTDRAGIRTLREVQSREREHEQCGHISHRTPAERPLSEKVIC